MSNQYTRAIARGERPPKPSPKNFLFAASYIEAMSAYHQAMKANPIEILKSEIKLALTCYEKAEKELSLLVEQREKLNN